MINKDIFLFASIENRARHFILINLKFVIRSYFSGKKKKEKKKKKKTKTKTKTHKKKKEKTTKKKKSISTADI